MELMVIEVLGVPCSPPSDRMADQLKIHFLKRRNSGGDVLTVIHPTSTSGQAYVVFESAEVPGVLECTHVLDIDNEFYPIYVKKAHLSEVDMPVETTLDLNMFPNPDFVLELLKNFEFNIRESTSIPGHIRLKGSFLKLKLIRSQLINHQGHEHRLHSRAPLGPHNGSSSGYDTEHNSLDTRLSNMVKMDAVSQPQLLDSAPSISSSYRDLGSGGSPRSLQCSHSSYTDRNACSPVDAAVQKYQWRDSNELLAHRWSPNADGTSSLSADSSSRLHHTSQLYRDPASVGFHRHLLSSQYSSIGSTSHTGDTDVLMQQQNVVGSEMLAHRQSPLHPLPSPSSSSLSKTSTSSPTMQHHTSYSDSASGGFLSMRPSFDGKSWSSSSHNSPSSSSGEMACFLVDTDILSFILTQRQDVVNMIEKDYGTMMEFKDIDGATMVWFLGKNSEKAKTCLLDSIKEISPSLRTQEIQLQKYDLAKQKQICERIQHNKNSGVAITLKDDVVKLVGSSRRSFEVMETILGNNNTSHRGRSMERSSNSRRCSSVPRQYKPADHARITDPVNQASAANTYSPLRYQEESDRGKALQIVQGPEQSSEKNSHRTRSNSESRDKNRTNREQSIQDVELATSNRGKKSSNQKAPELLKRLTPNISLDKWRKLKPKKSYSSPKND